MRARRPRSAGRDESIATIRALWRDGATDFWTESAILREFGPALTKADHKRRADRLLYAESWAPPPAPPRSPALMWKGSPRRVWRPRAVRCRRPSSGPFPMRSGPIRAFSSRASRTRAAPAAPTRLRPCWRSRRPPPMRSSIPTAGGASGAWWPASSSTSTSRSSRSTSARRRRRLADPANEVDRQFHAGWIALRFLGDAQGAAERFALAAVAAETPLSIARAEYWRGRAAEALGDSDAATLHYRNAATEPVAYYGQLAAQRLGITRLELRSPLKIAAGGARADAVRAAGALYALGLDDVATALAFEAARTWRDEAQIAAMAETVKAHADAATQVQFGKIAMESGYAFDAMAFPSSGVPAFLPLAHSADLASVYAVARQESEFVWRASSGAGAKGLMQILPSTAASTARSAGVAYDDTRLIVDPAFNTQLGAAFLGEVMEGEGGSRELAFAAYNAGPGRVAQWIAAYGDPRNGADPVDWVERIPFEETRDYVQRVQREPRRLPPALRRGACAGRRASARVAKD